MVNGGKGERLAAGHVPAGFHLMTPLNNDAVWSSVHGSVTVLGGSTAAGAVGVCAGVSTSMASSSRAGVADEGVATAWLLALPPPLFFGGMVAVDAVSLCFAREDGVFGSWYANELGVGDGKYRRCLLLFGLRNGVLKLSWLPRPRSEARKLEH